MKIKRLTYLLVLIQILFIILCYSRQGSFYYWDTFFSFQRIHYTSASTPGNHYIFEDRDYTTDEWKDISFVQDKLVVNYEESVLKDPPKILLRNLFKQPYWTIMNAVEAIFSSGKFTGWPGIVFNLVFLFLTQILLIKLAYKYTSNYVYSLVTVFIYGFCGMTLSLSTYVRFYIFSCFLCVAITYIHTIIWEVNAGSWYLILLWEIVAAILAKWSIELAPFSIFFIALFMVLFDIALFVRKRIRELLIYGVPLFAGGIVYIVTRTDYINILLNPKKYLENESSGDAVNWVVEVLLTLTPKTFIERATHEFMIVGKFACGYWPVLVILVLMLDFILKLDTLHRCFLY